MLYIIIGIVIFALSVFLDYRNKCINKFLFIIALIGSVLMIVAIPFIYVEAWQTLIGVILMIIGMVMAIPISIFGTVRYLKKVFKDYFKKS